MRGERRRGVRVKRAECREEIEGRRERGERGERHTTVFVVSIREIRIDADGVAVGIFKTPCSRRWRVCMRTEFTCKKRGCDKW